MANSVDAVMGTIDPKLQKTGGGARRPPVGKRKYAILRLEKIGGSKGSGKSKLAAAARHNLRERDAANARPEDRDKNIHLAGAKTARELMELWEKLAPEKVRTNAVHALEYIMTASPEEMAALGQTRSEDYLRDAFTWLEDKHGSKNILSAVIHMDETTPHLQVLVMPIDERGRMNARGLVGSKKELSAMQTDYAEKVGAKYGLERGIKGSVAEHETMKSRYGRVNAVESMSFILPERDTGRFGVLGKETDAEYHQRLSQVHTEALKTVAVGFGAELDEKDLKFENQSRELLATQEKLAEVEALYASERNRRHLLEFAHSVADYQGDDREDYITRFQEQYLAQCTDFPEKTRMIVDQMLDRMGGKGFYHIEQERLAEEQKVTERDDAIKQNRISHAVDRLSEWEARSSEHYSLPRTAEDHQEIIALLLKATTRKQYERFQQGDMNAFSHITENPLFAAQLLTVVWNENLANGDRMSEEVSRVVGDARDLVRSYFPEDRDHDYENER